MTAQPFKPKTVLLYYAEQYPFFFAVRSGRRLPPQIVPRQPRTVIPPLPAHPKEAKP